MNLAIRSSSSEAQSAPGLVFVDSIELLHLGCKEHKQSDFSIDNLVISMCRVFSCVVVRGCLLQPVRSLGKTLLALSLLYSTFQGQICLEVKWSEVAQSCPTLFDPMGCSSKYSSVHGISQAWILEWVAMSFSRGSSRTRDWAQVSRIVGRCFTIWATREPWITTNCGKWLNRWKCQITWPDSWETGMQVRKQQVELDMEKQTGSK